MQMQNRYWTTITCAALLLAGPVTWLTGCASTPTRESTGEYLDDSTITAKVKTAYATDPDVSAMRVKVVTYKGVVQLSGFVNTDAERTKAEQIARTVRGVKDVKNSLLLK